MTKVVGNKISVSECDFLVPLHLFPCTVLLNEKKEGAWSHTMRFVFISYTQWQRLLRLFIHATLTFRLIENSMHMWPIQNMAFLLITKKALESSSSVRYHSSLHSVWLTHQWTLMVLLFQSIEWAMVHDNTKECIWVLTSMTNFKWEKLCCGYMRG